MLDQMQGFCSLLVCSLRNEAIIVVHVMQLKGFHPAPKLWGSETKTSLLLCSTKNRCFHFPSIGWPLRVSQEESYRYSSVLGLHILQDNRDDDPRGLIIWVTPIHLPDQTIPCLSYHVWKGHQNIVYFIGCGRIKRNLWYERITVFGPNLAAVIIVA